MSEFISQVTEASYGQDVLAAELPVLLDLWAPWCVPCRAVVPVLESLAPEYAGVLKIAKINVEEYPEVQRKLGVRGIPTLILFRAGTEISRMLGAKPAGEFRKWLKQQGIDPLAEGALQREDEGPGAGAFHGDAELADFLVGRLHRRAENGAVMPSVMPHWENGKGTFSAALVSHSSTEVFSRLSGMPGGVAAAFEFCNVRPVSPAMVDQLLRPIIPGADLRQVAPGFALAILADAETGWPEILQDAEIDALRLRWIALARARQAGERVPSNAWQALATDLEQVKLRPLQPERERQRIVVTFLAALTPMPRSDETERWVNALVLSGREIRYLLAGSLLGWKEREFALERIRYNWYEAREATQPGGKYDDASLAQAHEAWYAEFGEEQRAHDAFFADYDQHLAPVAERARQLLVELLEMAPCIPAG